MLYGVDPRRSTWQSAVMGLMAVVALTTGVGQAYSQERDKQEPDRYEQTIVTSPDGRVEYLVVLDGSIVRQASGSVAFAMNANPSEAMRIQETAERVLLDEFEMESKLLRKANTSAGADPVFVISANDDEITEIIKDVASDPLARSVKLIEPNMRWYPSVIPNDTFFSQQWGHRNTGQTVLGVAGVNDTDINADDAWNTTTGSRDVVVAVVDTGIDYNHPDLSANMYRNPGEIAGNGIDDDRNGFTDDVFGYDAVNRDGNPIMDDSVREIHGTHVAGIIGARGNNASGVSGVAWNTSIMAVRALNHEGGTTDRVVEAFDYAIRRKLAGVNIRVINASLGGAGYSQLFFDKIQEANNAGILVVAAAGNGGGDGLGDDNDILPTYPASYDLPNIVSVASMDNRARLSTFSNFGRTSVDLAGPGTSVASTVPGAQYVYLDGTSMAAPHVTGVAALMYAVNAGLSPQSARTILMNTTRPLAALTNRTVSGGLVNALAAVQRANQKFSISGQITRAGAAVPSVTVTLSGAQSRTATTDANGRYTFTNIPVFSSYTIRPSKVDHVFSPASVTGVLNSNATVNFTASRTNYSISGTILNTSGNPISGASVTLAGALFPAATTDSQGRYSFAAVPANTNYSITAVKAGFTMAPASRSGVLTNNVTANFTATRITHTISGVVRRNGAGLSGVTMTLSGGISRSVVTGTNGSFSLTGIPWGTSFVLTPSKTGRIFTPRNISGTLTANRVQDFTSN